MDKASISTVLPLKPIFLLLTVDLVANMIDYGFHVFLGRTLTAGDFAVFQAVNAALLVAVAAFGVMQPVVARFVAEKSATEIGISRETLSVESAARVRYYLYWSGIAGGVIAIGIWVIRNWLAARLNVPQFAVTFGAAAVFFILLRPVITGALQGLQRFEAYSLVRLAFATGRVLVALVLLYSGFKLHAAVAALPGGQMIAVLIGTVLLGGALVQKEKNSGIRPEPVWKELRHAAWAFLAYTAYTLLLNADILWANARFDPPMAGAYATAALFRRVLLLLPGAATVILFPRVAAAAVEKRVPDRTLFFTTGFVLVTTAALSLLYFVFGPEIVTLFFNSAYPAAGALLGPMSVAIIGYALTAIWLNVFLATRPGWFVGLLWATAGVQAVLMILTGDTAAGAVRAFTASGWLAGSGGLLLYAGWLRPRFRLADDRR